MTSDPVPKGPEEDAYRSNSCRLKYRGQGRTSIDVVFDTLVHACLGGRGARFVSAHIFFLFMHLCWPTGCARTVKQTLHEQRSKLRRVMELGFTSVCVPIVVTYVAHQLLLTHSDSSLLAVALHVFAWLVLHRADRGRCSVGQLIHILGCTASLYIGALILSAAVGQSILPIVLVLGLCLARCNHPNISNMWFRFPRYQSAHVRVHPLVEQPLNSIMLFVGLWRRC